MTKFITAAIIVTAALAAVACIAPAAVQIEPVPYKDGNTALEGYLAYDDAAKGPAPLVLVVHEWWGLNDYAKSRACQLAELGFVAFAVDMYGKGVLAHDANEAGALAGQFRSDRPAMRKRIAAALDAVKGNPRVDPNRVAAIGYCFGGTAVLELARSGANIAGVVSFHGGLDAPAAAAEAGNIKCKVLVLAGADDRASAVAPLAAFEDEMRHAKADYQIVLYGAAVHGFTNPANGNSPTAPVAYNAAADRRSWPAMREFFNELFNTPKP